MKIWLIVFFCALPLMGAQAEGTGIPLKQITANANDLASVRRGAQIFANDCFSCHSVRYMRYSQLAKGLGLSDAQVLKNLALPGAKIGDPMIVAMPSKEAKHWFGIAPPDLTLVARLRGPSWLYAYLTGFYLDAKLPHGVNNAVFPNVAMPDILWQQQGYQVPVYKMVKDEEGKPIRTLVSFKQVTKGTLTPAQNDKMVHDLINYLTYVSAPYAKKSHEVGLWYILGLILFTIVAYALKRVYWKDIPH